MSTPSAIDSLLVHADFVRRIAVALVGRAAAEDLCQDTWAAVLQHPPADASQPRSWLATVLRNLFRDGRRRQLRQVERERGEAAGEPSVPAAADIAAREELRRQVVAAVLALPAELRDVVLLRYYEDLDSAAIGARLGRPAGTVRWQLHAAVQQLRRRLDGEHGERRAWAVPLGWWAKAQLGTVAAVLKVVWPLRAAVVAVLLLAIGWLVLPQWSGASPPLPVAPLPVAAVPQAREQEPAALPANERQAAPAVVAAASPHGPDELWGRVVRAADGTPVADAEVQLQHRDADEFSCNDLEYASRIDTLATSHTDTEGRFSFKVARAHLHRLHVRAASFAPATKTRCIGGSECILEVALGATLGGVVRETGSGLPLADILIRVDRGREHVDLAQGRTAPDGTFRFVDLPATQVLVMACSPHHELATASRALTAGGTETLELELDPGRVVTGRVVDAVTGAPIAGARIDDLWTFSSAAVTDADGRYSLGGVMQRSLFARAPGHVMAIAGLPSTAANCDFALARGGGLRGRLIDEAGRPLARGYVAAIATFMVTQGVMDEDWRPCELGGDGVFVGAELDPNRHYVLYARAPGRGAREVALPDPLSVGQVLDVGDVMLRPEARIEGRVVGSDGTPRPAAMLQLGIVDDPLQERPAATLSAPWNRATDAEGRFLVTGLSAGSYEIVVQDNAMQKVVRFGPYVLRDGEVLDGLDLTIPTGLSVSGRLVGPGGAAVPSGFQLFLAPAPANGGKATWTSSTANGSFHFEGLALGDYTLGCLAPAKGWSMSPVAKVAAGTRDLEIAVFPAATIRGRVVDRDGKVARANVHSTALGSATPFFREVATAADGSFTLEVPPDFVGSITARDPDNMFRQTKAENVVAGTTDLILRLQ